MREQLDFSSDNLCFQEFQNVPKYVRRCAFLAELYREHTLVHRHAQDLGNVFKSHIVQVIKHY